MARIKYKLARENLHVQLYFKKLAVRWQELPPRFFEMILAALGQRFNVQPGELSVQPANSLSETRVKYTIYGGQTSVSLLADRLAFDFPNLLPGDLGVVFEILSTVHDAFPKAFPELEQGRIEVQDFAHLDLGSQEAVKNFFQPYNIEGIESTFGKDLPVISTCYPKFALTSEGGDWKCTVDLEQSSCLPQQCLVWFERPCLRLTQAFLTSRRLRSLKR